MKKILCVCLACCFLICFSACSTKSNQSKSDPSAGSTTAEQTDAAKVIRQITAPVMETENWNEYEFTQWNGSDEMQISLPLPSHYTVDGTVVYNESGKKYAELVGAIVYKENQTAFDNLKLEKDYNGIQYKEKSTGTLGETQKRCQAVMGVCPTESGSWYVYCYALDFGEYAVLISMYTDEQYDTLPAEYQEILAGVTTNA